jgi:hypothetical protein
MYVKSFAISLSLHIYHFYIGVSIAMMLATPWLFATIDLQHVTNPAYNQDRGPVWIPSLRLHVEFGKSGGNGKH